MPVRATVTFHNWKMSREMKDNERTTGTSHIRNDVRHGRNTASNDGSIRQLNAKWFTYSGKHPFSGTE